jgi:hypothetical protein
MAYIGKQPVVGNFVKLDAITTSATATYNLLNGGVAYFPQTANNCIVSLNGVIQSPTSAYTISGSTIVFSDALTSSDTIDFILVLGDVLNIGTPSDSTVGFAKVTSNLITGATAETSIAGGDSVLIYDDSASALRKMTRTNFVSGIGGANTPAFQVKRTADQTISDVTYTKIQFTSEDFDTDSAFDSTTNYRFTVPSGQGGKYFIYFRVGVYDYPATITQFNAELRKNGTAISVFSPIDGTGSAISYGFDAAKSIILDLIATDYLELFVYINTSDSGTGLVISGTGYPSYFGGYKMIGI